MGALVEKVVGWMYPSTPITPLGLSPCRPLGTTVRVLPRRKKTQEKIAHKVCRGVQKGVQIGHRAQAGLVGCLWVHACQTGLIAMGLVGKRVGGGYPGHARWCMSH